MIKSNMDTLISKLIEDNINVLILDTCCLLDIIRVPERENIAVLDAAQWLLKEKSLNKFNIVLPSLIRNEWEDNVSNVCNQNKNVIKKVQNKINFINEISEKININTAAYLPDYLSFDVEIKLKDISNQIIDNSLVLEADELYGTKAIRRVVNAIPPSAKGKDSLKDCIIYEEALDIGYKLRLGGFLGRIIFASSNIHEYDNEEIKKELDRLEIIYANSLNYGVHEVSQYNRG